MRLSQSPTETDRQTETAGSARFSVKTCGRHVESDERRRALKRWENRVAPVPRPPVTLGCPRAASAVGVGLPLSPAPAVPMLVRVLSDVAASTRRARGPGGVVGGGPGQFS